MCKVSRQEIARIAPSALPKPYAAVHAQKGSGWTFVVAAAGAAQQPGLPGEVFERMENRLPEVLDIAWLLKKD